MRGSTLGLGSLVLLLAACGGAAPAVTPSLSSSPPQAVRVETAPDAKTANVEAKAETPVLPAIPLAEPTALTDAQRQRDAALTPKIAAIVDAFTNVDAELTKDRKRVLFRSNREGSWQAYLGDAAKPGAAPIRLTHLPHDARVMSARLTQDEKHVLFTSDDGADENFRIYRVKLDGSDVVNLTPSEKLHRDDPLLPRLRPSQMVYSARDNAKTSTDVFVQGIREGEPRKVYSDPATGFLLDVSPDGSHALFLRVRGPSDHVLLRLDLDEGTATRIFPQSEKKTVRVTSAAYSGDGKRAYIATDDGSDASYLLRIEPGSGIVSGRYKEESPATAQLLDVVVSPKDDRVAVVVDAGNRTETRILDDSLRPVAMVKSPLGSGIGTGGTGRFANDGKSFTAFFASADKPGDIFDVDASSGAMKALRSDARAGMSGFPKLDVSITSVSGEGVSIPINVYLPPVKKEKIPVIVHVHGGPAASARVTWNTSAMFWASQGYAVVEPNVRGSTGFGRSWELADNREKRGVALTDLASVNAWVREQAWADGDRIVVMGGSYGGYMTLMALSRQPGMWRAGIDLVGISDLRSFFRSTAGAIRSILVTEFGDPEKDGDLLTKLSPITAVDKIAAPLFVYQGQNDPRVPRSEADAIVTALRERKVPVEYMVAENEGHSIDRRETKLALFARAARFLDENVPKSSTPQPIAKK